MVLTALELKDKTFGTKFRGYDADEVDDFLDIVTRDYEELIRKNHEQELELKSLRERLAYFDEMKESLSQSVILAQETAEKVNHYNLRVRDPMFWVKVAVAIIVALSILGGIFSLFYNLLH